MDNNYFSIKQTLINVDEELRKAEEEANKPRKERKKTMREIFEIPGKKKIGKK